MSDQAGTERAIAGQIAHRVVAGMLVDAVDLTERRVVGLELARRANIEVAHWEQLRRRREILFDAVTAAGVYLHRLRPPIGWELLGAELTTPVGGRLDLVWQHTRFGVLADELKLGQGRSSETKVRDQIDGYVAAGTALWADRFIGVRLASVHEPARSRLFLPGRRRSTLVSESVLATELVVR